MKKVVNSAQVCSKVLQIGLGRFGLHLNKHLKEFSSFEVTSFKNSTDFNAQQINFEDYQYVFLTTPDSVIKDYASLVPPGVKVVHFSGFYYNPEILGVHPVKSFSKEGGFDLGDVDYVVDGELDENLKKIFIKTTLIKGENKKAYHTYLSVAANSLQLLMNELGEGFENETGLSQSFLKKIVIQSLEREQLFGAKSFSGPWTRKEEENQFRVVEDIADSSLKDLSELFKKSIERFNEKEVML